MDGNKAKTRSTSFEIVRIIAMLMIVMHHLVLHGIMHNPMAGAVFQQGTGMNVFFAWLFFPGGEVGVALFFMITGYFCAGSKKIRLKKVVMETVFYSWLSVILYFLAGKAFPDYKAFLLASADLNAKRQLVYSIFSPVRGGVFWFATAYIFLQLLLPVYNAFLEKLNGKGMYAILCILFLGLLYAQIFVLLLGFTKAFFFYSLGCFFRETHKTGSDVAKQHGGGYMFLAVFLWAFYSLLKFALSDSFPTASLGRALSQVVMLLCSCVLVTGISVSLFLFFMSLHVCDSIAINKIASATFGVYLLHDSFVARYFLWTKVVRVPHLFASPLFPLYAVLAGLAVLLSCSCLDFVRQDFIEPAGLRAADFLTGTFRRKFFKDGNDA